jgi:DNA-binding PadR family transcriptional regulator
VTTYVSVLQGLRWGSASAMELIAAISERTRGRVVIHQSLAYKAIAYLVDQGLARRLARSDRIAAIYQLTAKGTRAAAREAALLGRLFD